jgi:hypothetical protein
VGCTVVRVEVVSVDDVTVVVETVVVEVAVDVEEEVVVDVVVLVDVTVDIVLVVVVMFAHCRSLDGVPAVLMYWLGVHSVNGVQTRFPSVQRRSTRGSNALVLHSRSSVH